MVEKLTDKSPLLPHYKTWSSYISHHYRCLSPTSSLSPKTATVIDSSSIVTVMNPNLEPRDDMEFDTHEVAYELYKEYAKSVGFGTAKLNSRRSRASKEFID
ncbi:Protein FAR1-RELATED SEQUENCE [Forsythia ovata]|uniref:Protein FAR1-RELATED SEQUENCE n=1 Tax=Forsythia ovata TaxID=205694 RepID=A0ABD1WU27_9LAMI